MPYINVKGHTISIHLCYSNSTFNLLKLAKKKRLFFKCHAEKNCIKLEYYIVCGPSKLKWLWQKYILSRSTGNVYICSIKLCNLKECTHERTQADEEVSIIHMLHLETNHQDQL